VRIPAHWPAYADAAGELRRAAAGPIGVRLASGRNAANTTIAVAPSNTKGRARIADTSLLPARDEGTGGGDDADEDEQRSDDGLQPQLRLETIPPPRSEPGAAALASPT